MIPQRLLPINPSFADTDEYIDSLLMFVTSDRLFLHLCGGVHILDFLTQERDLYSTLFPPDWRAWFEWHHISAILDLLMRENLSVAGHTYASVDNRINEDIVSSDHEGWRDGPPPPRSLLDYIASVRKHALQRGHMTRFEKNTSSSLPRHVAVGMKPKKKHEVEKFSRYIADISAYYSCPNNNHRITHVIDFGSGQNYLGRALASPPYNMSVVALESKKHNISGAQTMDVTAKLAEKQKIIRNKKQYRKDSSQQNTDRTSNIVAIEDSTVIPRKRVDGALNVANVKQSQGRIQYIETVIENGDLSAVIQSLRSGPLAISENPETMVVSLHSCGNLLHNGLRSLILNPCVKIVAMVGCCYNLVTERLGPPTYKLPSLRLANSRLTQASSTMDPNGFPMSERYATYRHRHGEGMRMNITARMMACQAPQNVSTS